MPREKLARRDQRSEKVMTTVTPAELAAIRTRAKADGLTVSSWLRAICMRYVTHPKQPTQRSA